MEGQLPQKVKAARYKKAMKLQQRIAREVAEAQVGKRIRALVDQPLIARGAADAPDIDGRILLSRARARRRVHRCPDHRHAGV